MPDRGPNVLVVYGLTQWPLRGTIRDYLYSFRRYGKGHYFYLNIAARKVPRWVRRARFDAVVFHHSITGHRMSPRRLLTWLLRRAEPLKGVGGVRILLLQDESVNSEVSAQFINDFEIDHVFSVAPKSEWSKLYASVDQGEVRFSQLLTGYLEEDTVARVERIVAETSERPIDIGYRAWAGLPSLGRHSLLRTQITEAVGPAASARGLEIDLSNDLADTFHGDAWFRFLASCKYVLGVEGGATLLDRYGEFTERAEQYLAEHPAASFEEVEANCFPGEDGNLALFALSPRHLEACATRTCQILIEGDYSGVLRAGEHYISLKKDFSDLDEVLDLIQNDERREEITERAYRDVVASGRYGYPGFVAEIERAIAGGEAAAKPEGAPLGEWRQRLASAADRAGWVKIAVTVGGVRGLRRAARALLPRRRAESIERRLGRGLPSAE